MYRYRFFKKTDLLLFLEIRFQISFPFHRTIIYTILRLPNLLDNKTTLIQQLYSLNVEMNFF